MTPTTIRPASPEDADLVCDLVEALLTELDEEGEETGGLERTALRDAWRSGDARHFAFLAVRADDSPVGVVTVAEAFAFYAKGHYGIINELYVAPAYRSRGVGAELIAAVLELAGARGWHRVDVTAPESDRWVRTQRFYEREGFAFTGPKMKRLLS